MKTKVVINSKKDALKWLEVCNLLAKSMCDYNTVLSQFNSLSASDRINIKTRLNECDETRKRKIPISEQDAWVIGLMVVALIIACE